MPPLWNGDPHGPGQKPGASDPCTPLRDQLPGDALARKAAFRARGRGLGNPLLAFMRRQIGARRPTGRVAQRFRRGDAPTLHRVDLPCEQTGFLCPPPFDVHVKVLPNAPPVQGWTVLAHGAAGKPDALARWLSRHDGITAVRVEPGLAPKLLRATLAALPPPWAAAAAFVKVHHLDLTADGSASWFIEGRQGDILAFVQDLEQRKVPLAATEVRVRPVNHGQAKAPLSRRQFEALASAVALGPVGLRRVAACSRASRMDLLPRMGVALRAHGAQGPARARPYVVRHPRPVRKASSLSLFGRRRRSIDKKEPTC